MKLGNQKKHVKKQRDIDSKLTVKVGSTYLTALGRIEKPIWQDIGSCVERYDVNKKNGNHYIHFKY